MKIFSALNSSHYISARYTVGVTTNSLTWWIRKHFRKAEKEASPEGSLTLQLQPSEMPSSRGKGERLAKGWFSLFSSEMAEGLACFKIVHRVIYYKEPRNISSLNLVANVMDPKFPSGTSRLQRLCRQWPISTDGHGCGLGTSMSSLIATSY